MAKVSRKELHRKIEQLSTLVDALQEQHAAEYGAEGAAELTWEDMIEGKLDHIHDDLRALRERAEIPRPECYAMGEHGPQDEADAGRDGRA